jgi:hypothetical protein
MDTTADPNNCGGCGNVCTANAPSTAQCLSGHCWITLTTRPTGGYAVIGSTLYFLDYDGTEGIQSVPIGGGNSSTIDGSTGRYPVALSTFGGNRLYWFDENYNADLTLLPGGSTSAVTNLQNTLGFAHVVASSADTLNLYFVSGGYPEETTYGNGIIGSIYLAGGGISTLASYRSAGNQPANLLSLSDRLVMADAPNVISVSKSSGVVSTLVSNAGNPVEVSAYEPTQTVCWVSQLRAPDGTIGCVGYGAASIFSTPVTLASGQDTPTTVYVDGTTVYWGNSGSSSCALNGSILSVPLTGGQPTTLATSTNCVDWLTGDSTSLYWSNADSISDSSIVRLWPK